MSGRVRTHVPAATLVEIGENVETVQRIAPTRPHPAAPTPDLFHPLAGPGVGLVDRLRDRLDGRTTDPTLPRTQRPASTVDV
jgi:hypothetical protein